MEVHFTIRHIKLWIGNHRKTQYNTIKHWLTQDAGVNKIVGTACIHWKGNLEST